MPQREGSIYLTLFIVAMVLFVLSTVAFFFVYNQKEELRSEVGAANVALKRRNEINEALIRQKNRLVTLIAGPGVEDIGADEDSIQDFKERNLKEIQEVLNAAYTDQGRTESVELAYLIEPYGMVRDIVQRYQSLRDDAYQESREASTNLSATLTEKNQTIEQLSAQIQDLNNKVAEAQQQAEECATLRSTEREEHVREVANLQDQITDERIRSNRRIGRLENQIETLKTKLDRLEKEKRREEEFAELDPDGRLTRVVPSLQKGWIDLGRQDHLMKGLVFRVFQIVKGGRKIYKGRVEVRRVDEQVAEVRILEEVDPLSNPIVNGDFIASPFYDREEKPIFVFAGKELESKDVTKEFLEAKLESYGVQLRDAVDINTTFLVALQGYQVTDEYGRARELGVPVLRERDVLEFIGY